MVSQSESATSEKRIVLIDDDSIIRLLGSGILRRAGYHVDVHPDGEPALAFIHGGAQVDLVITDWMMPAVGGRDVIRSLRMTPATASMPVIVLTASVGSDVEQTLKDAGADAWLSKPIKPAALLETVRSLVEG
jgi:two-component system, chemotaxis family, chemotaxis protein CheY